MDIGASYRNYVEVPNPSKNRQHALLIALGDAIRRKRIERGLSQESLALIAELDRGYVGRVERGDNNVAILTLYKLATALQLTVTDLMKEAGL